MFLGAVVDAGADLSAIIKTIGEVIDKDEFNLSAVREHRGGIWGTRVTVSFKESRKFRYFATIRKKLEEASVSEHIKEKSLRVLNRLAAAEAKIHNVGIDEIHFHELGAVDTIVDVVGVITGLELLGITELVCSPLPMGRGTIICQHGILPNPPPAVIEILRGVPIYGVEKKRELVTPTGAALVAELSSGFGSFPSFCITKIGYGVGTVEDKNPPNLLRLVIGDKLEDSEDTNLIVMETNVDDMNPEVFSHLYDVILSAGALDVWATPCFMKKNRPAWVISLLCDWNSKSAVEEKIFEETTTAGIRYYTVSRATLERFFTFVETPWGRVRIKVFRLPKGKMKIAPEYSDCLNIANENKVSFREVYDSAYANALRSIQTEEV